MVFKTIDPTIFEGVAYLSEENKYDYLIEALIGLRRYSAEYTTAKVIKQYINDRGHKISNTYLLTLVRAIDSTAKLLGGECFLFFKGKAWYVRLPEVFLDFNKDIVKFILTQCEDHNVLGLADREWDNNKYDLPTGLSKNMAKALKGVYHITATVGKDTLIDIKWLIKKCNLPYGIKNTAIVALFEKFNDTFLQIFYGRSNEVVRVNWDAVIGTERLL